VTEPDDPTRQRIFWHRELPPLDAEMLGEHTLEATSSRVPGTLTQRGEEWDRCHQELMDLARDRFTQEMERLGGDYAHVLDESIEPRHDVRTNESWLRGRFTYVLYRRPPA
jgi:hypothetical protein